MNYPRLLVRSLRCLWLIRHYRLKNAHHTAYIAYGSTISPDLIAGEYTYVGAGSLIGARVSLGAYTMLGPCVTCMGDDHRYDRPGVPIIFSGRPGLRSTIIGRDAWIGTRAIILPGVEIGDGAIVAAGAVVSRSIPPCEIHGGIPNRKIRDRFASPAEKERHLAYLREPPRMGSFAGPKNS